MCKGGPITRTSLAAACMRMEMGWWMITTDTDGDGIADVVD